MKKHIIYDKESIDYQINLCALQKMEDVVPMTRKERYMLRQWVRSGHEIESNPWEYLDSDGWQLNYLQAYRLEYGYSSGPWDSWKAPENQIYWCSQRKCYVKCDELIEL